MARTSIHSLQEINSTTFKTINISSKELDSWNSAILTISSTLLDESIQIIRRYFFIGIAVILVALTIGGNLLVLIAFVSEIHLRTITNYFICSLAVTDLMVCFILPPMRTSINFYSISLSQSVILTF